MHTSDDEAAVCSGEDRNFEADLLDAHESQPFPAQLK